MKKVLYIHGAFSAFKEDSEKVIGLKKDFKVIGVNYDMETSYLKNLEMMTSFCKDNSIDFVVGTSLGALYSCQISKALNIPAVMINPCIEPTMSLKKIIGKQKNFTTNKEETLTPEIVESYPNIADVTNKCLIFVGLKDDLIDAERTVELFNEKTNIVINKNEDHYWEFFFENKNIKDFLKKI